MLLGQNYAENPWQKNVSSARLAVILAADVVRYSRLIEHDEAGTVTGAKAATPMDIV